MTHDEVVDEALRLAQAIKAGTLELNPSNAEAVKEVWAESIIFQAALREIGLDSLPDPEGVSVYPQLFEDWLVQAYAPQFASEDQARVSLACVRREILNAQALFRKYGNN